MSLLNNSKQLLKEFQIKYNINILNTKQGSEDWMTAKLGVVSASNSNKFVAKKGTAVRETYLAELVAQVCTGIFDDIKAPALAWGNQYEDAARSYYEFSTNNKIQEISFIYKDNSFRFGCSPDAIVDNNKGVEIKCPFSSKNYIQFLTLDKIKPEYVWQYQFTLWVTGVDTWDFVQYDPRMKKNPMHIVTVGRDEKKIKILEEASHIFIEDMDLLLLKAGFVYGEQWTNIKEEK